MALQTKSIINVIEEIKTKLTTIETIFIENKKASKEDIKAVKEALQEYKKGKTTPLKF